MVGSSQNCPKVRAKFRKFVPAEDGYGGDVELEIIENRSLSEEHDFLRPKAGEILKAFAGVAPNLASGTEVTANLTYVGGPSGGRVLLQEMSAASSP